MVFYFVVVVLVVSSAVQPNIKCLSVGSFLFTTSSFEMGVFRFLKLFSTVMGYTFANTSISSPLGKGAAVSSLSMRWHWACSMWPSGWGSSRFLSKIPDKSDRSGKNSNQLVNWFQTDNRIVLWLVGLHHMYPPKTSERQASTSTSLGSPASGSSFSVVSFSGSSPSPLAHRGRIRDWVQVGSRPQK